MNTLDPQELLESFDRAAQEAGFERELLVPGSPAYTRSGSGPTVMISTGIHGDEPSGPLAALAFLKGSPCSDIHWLLTPLLNPSGLAAGTRENCAGKDLNRDYQALQSAEIQAQCQWLARQPLPDLFISLHEDYEATGFYLYEIQTGGAASLHEAIFREVAPHLPLEPGPLIDGRESSGDGWFFRDHLSGLEALLTVEGGCPEAIFLALQGCPLSLTFETPTHAAPLETRISAHQAAIRAALDGFRTF